MPRKKVTTSKKVAKTKKKPAKVVAKKASTTKSAKKGEKKKATKKACSCVSKCQPTEAFWVNHGPVIHSMKDLLKALESMSDEQFAYHTKRNGNDFANWIKECLKDSASATSVKRVKSRSGAVRVLSKKCACK